MSNWSGVRQVIGPVALAVLVTMQLAAFNPAAAQADGGENVVDHTSHGAASVTPLAVDCSGSELSAHDGFQEAPTCADTAIGEIPAQQDSAQLLIVKAPKIVKVGQPITLKVSTRNLIRDRFLAAGQGGYYLESSLLNEDGLVRGHFHSACRMLADRRNAPAPDRAGTGLFVATEDGGGSATPDTVTVTLPGGLPTKGLAQCVVWSGDGSHRPTTNQFANQFPAADAVRLLVVGRGEKADDVNKAEEEDGRGKDQKPNDG